MQAIITESPQFLVENKRIQVNAFVIMDNHIHLIWQMMEGIKPGGSKRFYEIYRTKNKAFNCKIL